MSTDQSDFPSGGAAATGPFNGTLVPGFTSSGKYESVYADFTESSDANDSYYRTSGVTTGNNHGDWIVIGANNISFTLNPVGGVAGLPLYGTGIARLRFNTGKKYGMAVRLELDDSVGDFDTGFAASPAIGITQASVGGGSGSLRVVIGVSQTNTTDIYGSVFGDANAPSQLVTFAGLRTSVSQTFDCVIVVDPVGQTVDFTVNGVTQQVSGAIVPSTSATDIDVFASQGSTTPARVYKKPLLNYEL